VPDGDSIENIRVIEIEELGPGIATEGFSLPGFARELQFEPRDQPLHIVKYEFDALMIAGLRDRIWYRIGLGGDAFATSWFVVSPLAVGEERLLDVVEIEALPAQIEGIVKDSFGFPISRASVRLYRKNDAADLVAGETTSSDSSGRFRLTEPSDWSHLEVVAEGCDTRIVSRAELVGSEASITSLIEVSLKTRVSLELRLYQRSSLLRAGFMATLGTQGVPPAASPFVRDWRESGASVRLRSANLLTERSCIWVNVGGQWVDEIPIQSGDRRVVYEVPTGTSLSGTLVTPSGVPVAYSPVRLRSNHAWSLEQQVLTDRAGRFSFPLLQVDCEYEILSNSLAGEASLIVVSKAAPQGDLKLVLSEEPVSTVLVDSAGIPIAGVPLAVNQNYKHQGAFAETVISPGGSFFRAGLNDLTYSLSGEDGHFLLSERLNSKALSLRTVGSNRLPACSWNLGLQGSELESGFAACSTGALVIHFTQPPGERHD